MLKLSIIILSPLILNNGNTGIYFKLQRGVRQGCPLSAYLFITTLEILPNKIQNDTNIKGIKLNNKEIKFSLSRWHHLNPLRLRFC